MDASYGGCNDLQCNHYLNSWKTELVYNEYIYIYIYI
jgi:hypothetical protein